MIYLKLFWEFLKVGLFAFGGAYGAIPIIQQGVLAQGWMDETMFANIVAISESTPGPIMVNAATYIGTTSAGFFGAMCATIGVVTPSFVIILLIAKFLRSFMEKEGTRTVLDTIKPCVVGIILGTGSYLLLSFLIPQINTVFTQGLHRGLIPEWRTLLIFALVFFVRGGYRLWKKKAIPPILSIGIAAILGILVFGV